MQKKFNEAKAYLKNLRAKYHELTLAGRVIRQDKKDINKKIREVKVSIAHMQGRDIDWKF
jgi:predicted house-cleaning NTP pyrophosphatase (Maf/HAM1 superfamily)